MECQRSAATPSARTVLRIVTTHGGIISRHRLRWPKSLAAVCSNLEGCRCCSQDISKWCKVQPRDDSSVPLSNLVRVTKLLLWQDLHEQGILNLLPAD